MNISTKLLKAAAGAAGGAGLDVDEVFSTYLYEGNSSTQTITNGIDLSGEGGLVWIKWRSGAVGSGAHALVDTERGVNYWLSSSTTSAQNTTQNSVTSFNSNGFSIVDAGGKTNYSGDDYVSWTFRKAPKFFDVVTYSGDGTNNRQIAHNLGCQFGMLIVKCTSHTNQWIVWHISTGNGKYLVLNETNAQDDDLYNFFGSDNTTNGSTHFSVSSNTRANESGKTYVAYLFAHNNNDGEFGPDGDADIIKCGSYTGGSGNTEINLGFEPQFLMIKRTDSAEDWLVLDTMRGLVVSGDDVASSGQKDIMWNSSAAEATPSYAGVSPQPNGFKVRSGLDALYSTNGGTYIYMAIRRGGMQTPTAASSVFNVSTGVGSDPGYVSGFTVDMAFERNYGSTANTEIASRLTGKKVLKINSTDAESTSNNTTFDYMNGFFAGTKGSSEIAWMWKRARGYFDVVAYTGNSVAGRTINHNLGVAPEMMWVKRRSDANNWTMYHKGIDATAPEDYGIYLDDTAQRVDSVNFWNDTAPTSSVFTVGAASKTNADTATYIAYLFATVAGVSKVGSYTANGSAQNIDCGFTNGAKFVLIRRSSGTGNLFVIDTTRGIVAGNDPLLELNSTSAEDSGYDNIDPHSSGFTITAYGGTSPYLNISGATYIFYAIA
jgi:hypothetical protein